MENKDFDHLNDSGESESISQNRGDIEDLKCRSDDKADPVAPSKQLDHKYDLPHECEAGTSCSHDVRGKLRNDNVSQRSSRSEAVDRSHFKKIAIERTCSLVQAVHTHCRPRGEVDVDHPAATAPPSGATATMSSSGR